MLPHKQKIDIFLDKSIIEIKIIADCLRLYTQSEEEKQSLASIPAYQIDSIVLVGISNNLPIALFKLAQKHSIPIHFLSENATYYSTLHSGFSTKTISLRHRQYAVSLNQRWKISLAKHIIRTKINHQQVFCYSEKHIFGQEIEKLGIKIINLKSISSLNGIEGVSASLYWTVFGEKILKLGWKWHGRKKNPATDPVNLLLSLGYGLLATQCNSALSLRGFDPYLGIIHKTNSERPALVYDFMEIFRTQVVDNWILGLLQNTLFTPQDFYYLEDGSCRLIGEKSVHIFALWYKHITTKNLQTQTQSLSHQMRIREYTKVLSTYFTFIADKHKRQKDTLPVEIESNLMILNPEILFEVQLPTKKSD